MASEIIEMTYVFSADGAAGPRKQVRSHESFARTVVEIDRFDGGEPIFEHDAELIRNPVTAVLTTDGRLLAPLHDRGGHVLTVDLLREIAATEDPEFNPASRGTYLIKAPLLCYARRDGRPDPVPIDSLVRIGNSRQDSELARIQQMASQWLVGPDDIVYAPAEEPVLKIFTPHRSWIDNAASSGAARTAAIFGSTYVDDPLSFAASIAEKDAFAQIAKAHSAATGYRSELASLDAVRVFDTGWRPTFDSEAHLHLSISKWIGKELTKRGREDVIPPAVAYNIAIMDEARDRSGQLITPVPDQPHLPVDLDEVARISRDSIFHVGSQTFENRFMAAMFEHEVFQLWADLVADNHPFKSEDNPTSSVAPGI